MRQRRQNATKVVAPDKWPDDQRGTAEMRKSIILRALTQHQLGYPFGGHVSGSKGQGADTHRGALRSAVCRKNVLGLTGVLTVVLTVIQIAAMPAGPEMGRHALSRGSVWDSVYTVAQAGRGESTFRASCANCHGDSLMGINDAPPLKGPDFMKNWDGNTLTKLFNRINNDMPSDNPGSLSKPQVADVEAFILKANAFPAGSKELFPAAESLLTIKIQAKP